MADKADKRHQQRHDRCDDLRVQFEELDTDRKKNQADNGCKQICHIKPEIFPNRRPAPGPGFKRQMLMKEISVGNGNYIRDHRRRHVGDISGRKKKIEQIVEPDKDQIAKNRVPDAHQDKADFRLMRYPQVVAHPLHKRVRLFT